MKSVLIVAAIVTAILIGIQAEALASSNLANQHGRSPILHAMSSLFIPGFGQFLNGDSNRAIAHFMVTIFVDGFSFSYLQLEFALMLSSAWHMYSGCQAYTSSDCLTINF